MPLKSGDSQSVISENIRELLAQKKKDGSPKYTREQAVAIALDHAKKTGKNAKKKPKPKPSGKKKTALEWLKNW
jgi:hypothetical protein